MILNCAVDARAKGLSSKNKLNQQRHLLMRFCHSFILIALVVTLSPAMEVRGPQMAALSSDEAMISLHSSEKNSFQLSYGLSGQAERKLIYTGEVKQHVFVLKGLKAKSRYVYRLTSEGYDSGSRYFNTPPREQSTVRCALYGQSRYPNITLETHIQIADALQHQGFDFIVHTGNLLSDSPNDMSSLFAEDWSRNFFMPLASVIDHTPFYLAPGPFDVGENNEVDALRCAFAVYDRHASYLIERGPIAIAVISVPTHQEPSKAAMSHLEKMLQQMSFAQWRCVVVHTPIAGAGVDLWPQNEKEHQTLWELLYRYQVDLVVSGGVAQYQRVLARANPLNEKHMVHCINTGLGMQDLRYGLSALAYVQDRHLHYVRLQCTSNQLSVECCSLSANVYDKLIVTRDE